MIVTKSQHADEPATITDIAFTPLPFAHNKPVRAMMTVWGKNKAHANALSLKSSIHPK